VLPKHYTLQPERKTRMCGQAKRLQTAEVVESMAKRTALAVAWHRTGQLAQPNQDYVFSSCAALFNALKSKVGHIMAKARRFKSTYRVNLGDRDWHIETQRWIWAVDRSLLRSSHKRELKETHFVRNSLAGSKYVGFCLPD